VGADQRKACDTVVEGRGIPALRSVAVCAVGGGKRRTGGGVHGIAGLLPLGQVASGISAVGRCDLQIVVVVDVAGGAGNVRVAVGQQETGNGVVEGSQVPAGGGVAVRAVGSGEQGAGGRVRRIIRLLPCSEVTAGIAAGRRGDL